MRLCVDYRKLNDQTVKDSYPLPRLDGCLELLGGNRIFSTLDLRAGRPNWILVTQKRLPLLPGSDSINSQYYQWD